MAEEILFKIMEELPRQGPGVDPFTRQAYFRLPDVPEEPRILDIGCGVGKQTIALSLCTKGTIVPIDIHRPFLLKLLQRAVEKGVQSRISPIQASMCHLPFLRESFDLIWSEGAIFIMGFEKGLDYWKYFLRPEGCIVVSELSWLPGNPPIELREYWEANYPAMKTIEENIAIIEKSGYALIGTFILPDFVWWDECYTPLQQQLAGFWKRYSEKPDGREVLTSIEEEISMFRKFSRFYGYVFYLMQNK
jgi:ubiquinone/menaquinone biosynthesis C-methylase UbiE